MKPTRATNSWPGILTLTCVVGLLLAPIPVHAEDGAQQVEWPHYGGDRASSKYSEAAQITAENVSRLELAWRFRSPDPEVETTARSSAFKATPLMIGGRLYVVTALNLLVALDPATGKELWRYDPKAYERGQPPHGGFSSRGVEYWSDSRGSQDPGDERILLATGSLQLVAVNAKTGKPYPEFGSDGIVDLRLGLGREINVRDIGLNSPAIVCGDTVVVGSVISDFRNTMKMPPGHVRGYDVRTGKRKWIFHTIPQEEEYGVETWENEAWKYSGNTNVWTLMSCDEELGYVYLPTSTPSNDHYGGHRLGDNLFAESLVCLNADSGERVWHFQAVHHGLWDYDFPCAPNLVDVTVGGKRVKAVAQVSKQGFTYVFDRATGEPVWPIEERPVAPSTVAGERTAPTQPFPTKPPPFERQGIGVDDLIDFTPELRAEALKIVEDYVLGPLFTPPIVEGQGGKKGLIQVPGMAGGANWGGAAFDVETGFLYVPSQTRLGVMGLRAPDRGPSDLRYNRGGTRVAGPRGLPLLKPPYARISAIDLNEGTLLWQVPHGDGPRDHPALEKLQLERLGTFPIAGLSPGGPVLTKTLLFMTQSVAEARARGYIRAFDKETGELIAEHALEVSPQGTPMTYVHHGKQYLVFASGGRGAVHELVAYALP